MTSRSLLSVALYVVSTGMVSNVRDIISVIPRWEAKLVGLKKRYNEDVSPDVRTAIVVFMMPKNLKGKDLGQFMFVQNANVRVY